LPSDQVVVGEEASICAECVELVQTILAEGGNPGWVAAL
jgi:hypothetical protein